MTDSKAWNWKEEKCQICLDPSEEKRHLPTEIWSYYASAIPMTVFLMERRKIVSIILY